MANRHQTLKTKNNIDAKTPNICKLPRKYFADELFLEADLFSDLISEANIP